MPPITDNPTDRAREDGSDEQWAQWEKTFRDARPVLPELAMARIESAMHREVNRVAATPAPSRLKRNIFFLLITLLAATSIAVWTITHSRRESMSSNNEAASKAITLRDQYPLEVPIGPQLIAPEVPLLVVSRYMPFVHGDTQPYETLVPSTQPQPMQGLLQAAERQCAVSNDGWHALGLLEMRRAANLSAAFPNPVARNTEEFHLDAAWRLLPLKNPVSDEFREQLSQLRRRSEPSFPFWQTVFALALQRQSRVERSTATLQLPDLPRQFPSTSAQKAHMDLLTEMGVSSAQAALAVLTARSYLPLGELQAIDRWLGNTPMSIRLRQGYLLASQDLNERDLALRLAGRNHEADALIAKALNLRYLTEARELAVLLARLGPDDAYEQLLRPLMENEVAFIENPPKFDDTSRRSTPVATVEGNSKSVQEGVTHYTGNIKLSAGPWRVKCDNLAVFRNIRRGSLLTCTGSIHVRGVLGLFGATADEATLNTETGELHLAGHVHLDGWEQSRDLPSCTILRTGDIRP